MDSRGKTANVNKEYFDQRVRGHDFLTYFRSHLMTICLVFWFLTISISVAATAIYLIKKMEIESKKHAPEVTSEKNNAATKSSGARYGDDNSYIDVDVVGFLIDTFYPGNEGSAAARAEEAAKNATSTNYTVPEGSNNDVDDKDDVYDKGDGYN